MSVTNAISSVIVVGALIAVSVSTTYQKRDIVIAVDNRGNTTVDGKLIADNAVPQPEVMRRVRAIAAAEAVPKPGFAEPPGPRRSSVLRRSSSPV
jgi:hypothetical protein